MRLRIQAVVAIGMAVLAAGIVFVWQTSRPAVATAQSLVAVEPGTTGSAAQARPGDLVFLARGYAARARSGPVLAAAAKASKLGITADEVAPRLAIEVSNDTGLMTVTTTGPTDADAVALNRAVTRALSRRIQREATQRREQRLAPLDAQIAEVEQVLVQAGGEQGPRVVAARAQYQALLTARTEAVAAPVDSLSVVSPPAASGAAGAGGSGPTFDAALTFLVGLAIAAQVIVAVRLRRRRDTGAATGAVPAEVTV